MENGTFPAPGRGPGRYAGEREWMEAIRQLIGEGQTFLAHDLAWESLEFHPGSLKLRLLATLALVRGGADDEARRLLGEVTLTLGDPMPLARELWSLLRRLPALEGSDASNPEALEAVAELARRMVRLGSGDQAGAVDGEALKLLGRIHFELWRNSSSRDHLQAGRDACLSNFRAVGDPECGIDGAIFSRFLGDEPAAQALAQDVARLAEARFPAARGKEAFRLAAYLGEARLLLGEAEGAVEAFRRAAAVPERHYAWVVEARHRLQLLAERGFDVPEGVFALLRPPTVVVFTGEDLDQPGEDPPVFPPALEEPVKREIRRQLDALGAEIGYCAASAGSCLLFAEAMLERGGEVHLHLPCSGEDFIAARVRHGGPGWVRRFHTATKLAATVTFATEERLLGHDVLFRFNNQMIEGAARLRSQLLGVEPKLLAVIDYTAARESGAAADFMDHWPDIASLRLIDLEELRSALPEAITPNSPVESVAAAPASPSRRTEPSRVIKAMLFADIVGFSKLREEELPGLWGFLEEIQGMVERGAPPPDLVESWGDALYVVTATARHMLRYAFLVQQGFARIDPVLHGLSQPLRLRVGLHAGPVYEGFHPLTDRRIIYGSHVSRAARIEPVTVPGQIYASQQFVSLLTAEENRVRHEALTTGEPYAPWYAIDYLGIIALAKNYGSQPAYHIKPLAGSAGP
ncbi:MAG: adenylate/guanylate cyclase domain-containing protein [Magnetococcales bacterium]|nr:adenylate/guanylate cyclase domain-containing protein [Magnetococcales bacterium]